MTVADVETDQPRRAAPSFPKEVIFALLEAHPGAAKEATKNDCDQPPQVRGWRQRLPPAVHRGKHSGRAIPHAHLVSALKNFCRAFDRTESAPALCRKSKTLSVLSKLSIESAFCPALALPGAAAHYLRPAHPRSATAVACRLTQKRPGPQGKLPFQEVFRE